MATTELMDLPPDVLLRCASLLDLKDVLHLAMCCKRLRQIAYSDEIWERQCRLQWPATSSGVFLFTGGRDDYLRRLVASQQFRFDYPFGWGLEIRMEGRQLLLHDDGFLVTQGSRVVFVTESLMEYIRGHNAPVTCMRIFPRRGIRDSLFGYNVLATSSDDHTIRTWGPKGRSLKVFRGHTAGVSVIADKVLGEERVIASGGMDNTVRLWNYYGGRNPLLATLYGHESHVKDLAVAGHNTCILISGAKDSKLRVWDSNTGACVGNAKGTSALFSVKTFQSTCYAAGSLGVTSIDLKTMKTTATYEQRGGISSMALSRSGEFLCTGGNDGVCKLWDVRSQHRAVVEFSSSMSGSDYPVQFLHLEELKVVSGSPYDTVVNVWDPRDGTLVTGFDQGSGFTTRAVACQGTKIAISYLSEVFYRDYSTCLFPDEAVEAGS